MLSRTDTDYAPWICIKSDDKKRARINAMRYLLHILPYDKKDESIARAPERDIVGTPERYYGIKRTA